MSGDGGIEHALEAGLVYTHMCFLLGVDDWQ